MTDWIIGIIILSGVIYKLGQLTEIDIGRGWFRLRFSVANKRPPKLPPATTPANRKKGKE
jgi:hypothetical protein